MKLEMLKEEIEKLQTIVEYCEENGVKNLETVSNTYFLESNRFMQVGSHGFFDYGSVADAIECDMVSIENGQLIVEE